MFRRSSLILAIYFISGGCSLIYQIIWRRLLKLSIGNTTYATSITIGVFMAGLALGALLMRKRSDSIKNKLKVYAIIELLISLFALSSLWILNSVDVFYKVLYQSFSGNSTIVFLFQIIVSSIALLIPTILMGSTLPLLSSWLVKYKSETGHKVGLLYSINTFGALAGTALSGFYLIRIIGVSETLYMAVILNILISFMAFLLYKLSSNKILLKNHNQQSDENHSVLNIIDKKSKPDKVLRSKFLIYLIFLTGFVSLAYEIIWMRTIVHFLRAEIYVFSAILSVYLLGYSIGVHISTRLSWRVTNLYKAVGIILLLIGCCGLFYIPMLLTVGAVGGVWFRDLPAYLLSKNGYVIHIFYSFILFLIPSIFMGMGFPFIIQLWREQRKNTGDTVSTAYAINTLGCVLGTLVCGFILIPFLGAQRSIIMLGAITLLSSLVLFFKFYRRKIYIPVGVVAILLLLISFLPSNAYVSWINICESRGQIPTRLVDVLEGINTTASVHLYPDNTKVISSAGINVAGDSIELRQTQKVQSHVPIILHGNPEKVITVGFGSGELTKTLTMHDIPDISCVEIAPEMVNLSKKHFSHINLGKDLENHINMIYMDAKNYFHLTNNKYDVIMNDSIWPGSFAESSSLYTEEYFRDGKKCLTSGGVYSTWLPVNLPDESLMSILKTFNKVFDNTILVYPHNYPAKHLLMVGQKGARKYSYEDMLNQFNKTRVRDSLKLIGINELNHLLDFIFIDSSSIGKMTEGYSLNSDFYPVVEFDVGRGRMNLIRNFAYNQLDFIKRKSTMADYSRIIQFKNEREKKEQLSKLRRVQRGNQYLIDSIIVGDFNQRIKIIEKALSLDSTNPDFNYYRKVFVKMNEMMKKRAN